MSEPRNDTKTLILQEARATVQALGYNALSYRELGKAIGVKSSSIHYHFPTKGDLGAELARAYTDEAQALLDELVAQEMPLQEALRQYAKVFRKALEDNNRMCLCGIMAAERDDLPAEVLVEVERFIKVNVEALTRLLTKHAVHTNSAQLFRHAMAIFTAIEGAQLVARGLGDIKVYDHSVEAYRAVGLLG